VGLVRADGGIARSPAASRSREAECGTYILTSQRGDGQADSGLRRLCGRRLGSARRDHAGPVPARTEGRTCPTSDNTSSIFVETGATRRPRITFYVAVHRLARYLPVWGNLPFPRPLPPQNVCMRVSARRLRATRGDRTGRHRRRRTCEGERIAQARRFAEVPGEHSRRSATRRRRAEPAGVDEATGSQSGREIPSRSDSQRRGARSPTCVASAEQVEYAARGALTDVWIAVRANLRAVLEQVTIADLASGSYRSRSRSWRRIRRLAAALATNR